MLKLCLVGGETAERLEYKCINCSFLESGVGKSSITIRFIQQK